MAEEWRADAACLGMDTELFYAPESPGRPSPAEPLKVCVMCPVRLECLTSAMRREHSTDRNERYGIWGGYTARERIKLAQRRAA